MDLPPNQRGFALYLGAFAIVSLVLWWILRAKPCQPSGPGCPERGRDQGANCTYNPIQCTLFSAVYVPWTPVPRYVAYASYQPHVANFLFRMCWNVTTTNCFEHRYDFNPPAEFDTVVRVCSGALSPNKGRMYAYFLHSSATGLTLVAFTGTAFEDDWLMNLVFKQVPPVTLDNVMPSVAVHLGFYTLYSIVQAEIRKLLECYAKCTRRLVVTGYSLGAALATVCAYDVCKLPGMPKLTLYTFGGPRVFNPLGAEQLDRMVPDHWRIYNTEDIVKDMPPSVCGEDFWNWNPFAPGNIVYAHCGRNVCWTRSTGSILNNHSSAYEHFLFANTNPWKGLGLLG